eukprot:295107_1
MKLISTIQELKHNSYQKLLQTHNKNNIPNLDYFDTISIRHPDIFDIFELFEEDCVMDIISNPVNEWIYVYNKTDINSTNLQMFNQSVETIQIENNKQVQTETDEENEKKENNNEERKQFVTAPMLWHSYQGVKYTSQKNVQLARDNKIHFTFFGILVYAFKYMGLWNHEIMQNNLKNEMEMHGMSNDDLLNTINFGIKLTQKQISELIAATKWLPSETDNEKEINHVMIGYGNIANMYMCNREERRYNAKLSMCMYFRKAFDGTVQKTTFTCDEQQYYLKIFAQIIGLHENEVAYIQKLYETEHDLCDFYHSCL